MGKRTAVHSEQTVRRTAALLLAAVMAASVAVSTPAHGQESPDEGAQEDARARLIDVDGQEVGVAHFAQTAMGGTVVSAFVRDLPPGLHGLHIHAGSACTDEDGAPDFTRAKGHLGHRDPAATPHGTHAGDLPNLLVGADGTGTYSAFTWRFDVDEAAGRTIIVHADADNHANVPERYVQLPEREQRGPDEATRTTGDAGDRQACGVIALGVPDLPAQPAETRRAEARLVDTDGEPVGLASFVELADGSVVVSHALQHLAAGFRGFHIHAGGSCTDENGDLDFTKAGGHYNPEDTEHGEHAGDLPVALVTDSGVASVPRQGFGLHRTDRFRVDDVIGRTVIVHAHADNAANIPPERYLSWPEGEPAPADTPGPDEATRATGDAGGRDACGVVEPSGEARRLFGPDRIDTAIAASRSSFPDSASAVVLTRSDLFADGLAGTPLAVANDAPLLLTSPRGLDPRSAEEITRLLPDGGTVYLLGGPNALSEDVEDAVAQLGVTPRRVAGRDRIHTALQIAAELGDPDTLLITTGFRFPDALAAGAAAAHVDGAVLLTSSERRHPDVDAYLERRQDAEVVAVGGPAARPYDDAEPVFGANRVATAVEVAERFFADPPVAGLVRQGGPGDDTDPAFADGLSGGAHIARLGGPVLLTPSWQLHATPEAYLAGQADTLGTAYLYGGDAALEATVAEQARAALGGAEPAE